MYFRNVKKVNSAYEPSAQANTGFYSMKQLGVFLLLSGWDASPTTWMDGGNVRVYCLTQEYDTASPARSHAWGARYGVQRLP